GAVAAAIGITQATLRRAFLRVTGLKPRELAEALRIKRFKAMLRSGKSITDALYETGYGSPSRVYERSNAQLGMTPATYQKGGKGMKHGYTIADANVGKVLVAATDHGVSAAYLGDSEAKLLGELRDVSPKAEIAPASIGLEAGIFNFEVLHHSGVVNDEVIAGVGFKKLLLNRHPRAGVHPHLNFGDLLAGFLGFRRQLDKYGFTSVEFLLAIYSDQIIFLKVFAAGIDAE